MGPDDAGRLNGSGRLGGTGKMRSYYASNLTIYVLYVLFLLASLSPADHVLALYKRAI